MLKYNTTDHDSFQMNRVSELYRNPCDTQVRKTGLRYTSAGQRTRPFYQYSASNSFFNNCKKQKQDADHLNP